jgi:hypothetical protein
MRRRRRRRRSGKRRRRGSRGVENRNRTPVGNQSGFGSLHYLKERYPPLFPIVTSTCVPACTHYTLVLPVTPCYLSPISQRGT